MWLVGGLGLIILCGTQSLPRSVSTYLAPHRSRSSVLCHGCRLSAVACVGTYVLRPGESRVSRDLNVSRVGMRLAPGDNDRYVPNSVQQARPSGLWP
ncbi:hypothetical protein F4802DRAFT_275506 [Xylaria palmicola]|nr:hypothetical protein F4802DRAFT_275506 [Xylaria palmicola]